jgi:hypothetical protein
MWAGSDGAAMSTTARIPVAAVLAATALAAAGAAGATRSTAGPYGWPVKPFDRPHTIRGGFGDPRTLFAGPPTRRTLLTGGGLFSFHDGVDIAAPNGTPVYPVASGTVVRVTPQWLSVDTGGGRVFQYWHIRAAVTAGQRVEVDATVLGRILPSCGHVHLTELEGGVPVDPLQPGHLTPYADTTRPVVQSVAFRASITAADELPELLRGRVELVASAYDTPSVPVTGPWHGLPVTPALLEWRVQTTKGRVAVPTHRVFDVRATLPSGSAFWTVYARGTHQNMAVFGRHYSFMQPGAYLFRLSPGGFDTRTLPDGVYELVVTAADVAGNRGSLTQRFSVHNRPGVVGP